MRTGRIKSVPEPERIRSVNLNYLGNALFTAPALCALRARFPRARIDAGTVLYDAFPCAPCRKSPTGGGAFRCLRLLTPERVCQAVLQTLGTGKRRPLMMANAPQVTR